jgi:hypothetical protein
MKPHRATIANHGGYRQLTDGNTLADVVRWIAVMMRTLFAVALASGCTRDAAPDRPAPALAPAPRPSPTPAPQPEPHQLHYQVSAMAGVWRGKAVPGLDLLAEVDLDHASIATRDPGGERRRDLTTSEARELRELATAACQASRRPPANSCTDAKLELWINDGSCHAMISDTCPFGEATAARLATVISQAARWH